MRSTPPTPGLSRLAAPPLETVVGRALSRLVRAHRNELGRSVASWLHAAAATPHGERTAAERCCPGIVEDLARWLQDPGNGNGADVAWPNLDRGRAAQLACSATVECLRSEGALASLRAEEARVATSLLARYFQIGRASNA